MDYWILLGMFSIPSAITGFAFWMLQKSLNKAEARRSKREECLMKYQLMLIDTSFASISLGKATAIAVKEGKCNGEMKEAFEKVAEVEKKQKDYLNLQAIEHIF